MKKIIILDKNKKEEKNINIKENKEEKTREIIKNVLSDISLSNFLEDSFDNHNKQQILVSNLFMNNDFCEKKFLVSELKKKISSYQSQDIKKNFHEKENLITLNNVIEKLYNCNLFCYYCNCKIFILFKNVRYKKQWTLDRINNYDEHTNSNTIISCLECNLQRRRKNSDKFLFTKRLETNQITINKLSI
tara:strand:+ start:2356 stop:2925 length:570 start_codon:yes stop_codon:yes gene_type:complete